MNFRTLAAGGAAGAALAFPAAAGAATLAVTGDDGQPVALSEGTALEMRNMSPTLTPSFSSSEKKYSLGVIGPDGKAADLGASCRRTDDSEADSVDYSGNGAYTVTLSTYADENDLYCEQSQTTQTFTFTINAHTAVIAPQGPLMQRKPGGDQIGYTLRVELNPGAHLYQLLWTTNPTFTSNGGFEGSSGHDFHDTSVDSPDGSVEIEFPSAGVFTFIASAIAGGGSPFSSPVTVKVLVPFDFQDTPFFRDARWPTFKMDAQVSDDSSVGHKVFISIAKGKGKFKPLTTAKVNRTRTFAFKFRQRKSGRYRLKYVYKGAGPVAPGAWVQAVKLGKSTDQKDPVYVGRR